MERGEDQGQKSFFDGLLPQKTAVNDDAAVRSLEEAARRLGVEVRYETLKDEDVNISSGSCVIKGGKAIIIDRRLPAGARWKIIARELKTLDVTGAYLPPLARELLDLP
ncbi:MAG: hypothetical protein HY751_07525 [Nitrospinae bacterium]|nr:hypothetical protein [Nitrospinota bacterium]